MEKTAAQEAYARFAKWAEDEEEDKGTNPILSGMGYGALGGGIGGAALPLAIPGFLSKGGDLKTRLLLMLFGGGMGALGGTGIGAGIGALSRLKDKEQFGGPDEVARASAIGRTMGMGSGWLPGTTLGALSALGPDPARLRHGHAGRSHMADIEREFMRSLRRRTLLGGLLGIGTGGLGGAAIGASVGHLRKALRGDEEKVAVDKIPVAPWGEGPINPLLPKNRPAPLPWKGNKVGPKPPKPNPLPWIGKSAAGDVKEMPAEPQTDMLQKMHPAAKSPFTTAAKPSSAQPAAQNSGIQRGI